VYFEHSPRWRRLLKDAIASAIWRARTLPLSGSVAPAGYSPLVIGYHRVVEDVDAAAKTDMPTLLTSAAMFERHIDWIGRHFQFVSLDDIGERIERDEPFTTPVAAVTFDDGYRDVYENAIPILKRKGIPGAMFVVTDLVGRSDWQIHDRLYHLLDKAYDVWEDPWLGLTRLCADADLRASDIPGMRAASRNPYSAVTTLLPAISQADADRLIAVLDTQVSNGTTRIPRTADWSMLEDMHRAGFTIGSHTKTHIWLAHESEARNVDELAGSKQELERRLNAPVHHFAYPGGQFTPQVVELVARAGYRFAYTACEHQDAGHPELTIQRLLLWEGSSIGADGRFSSAILDCQTHRLWPPARRCERVHAA
jgi:peptidoglycan/xylan/chitin deacetylase (PgdA/CDA1 family)